MSRVSGLKNWIAASLASALLCALAFADPEEGDRLRREPAASRPNPEGLKKPQPCPPAQPRDVPPGEETGGDSAPEVLAVEMPDMPEGCVAAFGDGFVTLVREKDGDKLYKWTADGGRKTVLAWAVKTAIVPPAWMPDKPAGEWKGAGEIHAWWLSPDGKLAAWSTQDGLFAAPTAGGEAHFVTNHSPLDAPGFAPDGKHLAVILDNKLEILATDGSSRQVIAPEEGLFPGRGPLVYSADGKRVFSLVAALPGQINSNGLGAADLTAEKPVLHRIYETAKSGLCCLRLSADGLWLAFLQSVKENVASLRLYATDGSEFRTVARATNISEPAFSADGTHVYFGAPGANGIWTIWEAGLTADGQSGEFPVRRLCSTPKWTITEPSLSADGTTIYARAKSMEVDGRDRVVRLKVK